MSGVVLCVSSESIVEDYNYAVSQGHYLWGGRVEGDTIMTRTDHRSG
jgi:hypothetical protein